MGSSPVVELIVVKCAYALCGGIGAVLAIALAAPAFPVIFIRIGVGFAVCFLAAEPLRCYLGWTDDPHTHIAMNGLIGFISWYALGGLDRVVRKLTDEKTLLDLVKKRFGGEINKTDSDKPADPPKPV